MWVSYPLFDLHVLASNGKDLVSPIWSVIKRLITKSDDCANGSPICLSRV